MAGKIHFRGGKIHSSRYARSGELYSHELTAFLASVQEVLGCTIDPDETRMLVFAVCFVRAESKGQREGQADASRKDMLAQLRAMDAIRHDADLVAALRGCDRRTLEAIRTAHTALVSQILFRDGQFIDAEGIEHLIPPDIEILPGPASCAPVYLPDGVAGLRAAVKAALIECEANLDAAGNRAKPHQLVLAAQCLGLGRRYCAGDCAVWRWGDDSASRLVSLARIVFSFAGIRLSDSRLVAILKKV